MTSPREINRVLSERRDPKLVAALADAAALGLNQHVDAGEFFRSIMVDAAETIGIPVGVLDLSRDYHVRVMTEVATALVRDEIEAAGGTTENSKSSYLQKTR